MARSRLQKIEEQRAIKNTLLAIGGTIIVLFLVIKYGIPFLANYSLIMEKIWHRSDANVANKNLNYVEPPILNPTYTATNSATVDISGYAQPKESISLYINGKLIDKTDVKDNKSFEFSNVPLEEGENNIKAKAKQDNSESDYSSSLTIIYTNKEPSLTIDSPSDGQSFHKDQSPIKVAGKTDAGDKVTVNGFWAIVDDQGNYSYSYNLHDGDNDITVEAVDDAGNKASKQIKIHVN